MSMKYDNLINKLREGAKILSKHLDDDYTEHICWVASDVISHQEEEIERLKSMLIVATNEIKAHRQAINSTMSLGYLRLVEIRENITEAIEATDASGVLNNSSQ